MFSILVCDEALNTYRDTLFANYNVDFARNSDDILNLSYEKKYDLFIVNIHYHSLLSELNTNIKVPTIFTDEFYTIEKMKIAFKVGDDYIIKPIYVDDFEIRIDYYYRKLFNHSKNIISLNDFYYHIHSKQLFYKNKKIKLSPNELKLLEVLLKHLAKPVSKTIIYDELQSSSEGSLRVYISKLNKIGFDISYDRSTLSYTLS
ncbi:MAG: hypothetical protein Q9M43_07645 [Sulfurimonas sp.]|nr:hypothetical protein [Sulfurimonas sp.]